MMHLKYKFRLYPTTEQEQLLLQHCGAQRFIWNYYLAKEIEQYDLSQIFNFYNHNSANLALLKKQDDYNWLQNISSTSLQQTLQNLDKALKQSFKKNTNKKGFPKFKKKKNFNGSFSMVMVNKERNIKENDFFVSRAIGNVKCIYHRKLPSDFKSCTIKQEAGKWFVVLTCIKAQAAKKEITKTTGVDLNSKSYVTTDDIYEIPKFLRENQMKIKKLQRKLSRCQKGSQNRKKVQLKLQRIHRDVANKRLDFFHKLSSTLVNSYDLITIEDLDVKAIQQKFGKVIQDNGFGMFRAFLEYKCELYGTNLVIADRYFPSSQKCSECGGITKHELNQRTYTCNHCGHVMDRDLNASMNLKQLGVERTNVMPMDVDTSNADSVFAVLAGITNEVGKILGY